MQIGHIALWCTRIEELRKFYVGYFGGVSNAKYTNPAKGFESYFISFGGGCQLELMHRTDITAPDEASHIGLCHMAFDCRNCDEVLALTEQLRADGHPITGEPRTSGDGYFESVVADPEGNIVEIVFKA